MLGYTRYHYDFYPAVSYAEVVEVIVLQTNALCKVELTSWPSCGRGC